MPQLGERIDRCVVEEGSGTRFDPGVSGALDLFTEALHEARFADASLADDQSHLTFTFERTIPTVHQRAQFVLAANEWGESARGSRDVETSARSARLNYTVNIYWTLDALE